MPKTEEINKQNQEDIMEAEEESKTKSWTNQISSLLCCPSSRKKEQKEDKLKSPTKTITQGSTEQNQKTSISSQIINNDSFSEIETPIVELMIVDNIKNNEIVKNSTNNKNIKKPNSNNDYISTRQWLDKNYPNKEVKEIYINEQLEGELYLTDYDKLEKISISRQVDKDKLEIKNKNKETKIIELVNAREYLHQIYPTKEEREQVREMNISDKNLEGELDFSDFVNLEVLVCVDNKLTSINVSNCGKLERFGCYNNQLTNLDLSNCSNLTILKCWNNQLTTLNLTNCSQLTEMLCSRNKLTQLILPKQLDNLRKLNFNKNLLDIEFVKKLFKILSLLGRELEILGLDDNNFSPQDIENMNSICSRCNKHIGEDENKMLVDTSIESSEYSVFCSEKCCSEFMEEQTKQKEKSLEEKIKSIDRYGFQIWLRDVKKIDCRSSSWLWYSSEVSGWIQWI